MKPGSPEWARLVTASKVAAILGVSPWDSPRSIWLKMHGDLPAESEGNDAQRRGHYLEPAILAWFADQHDVTLTKSPLFRLDDWAAATPDAEVNGTAITERAIVEAKSAARDDDWGDPGTDAIPTYYLTQCYFQLALSGAERCYVPVLTSRLRFVEYIVEADEQIQADLIARMRSFYDTLSADEPPPLDDTVATYEAVRKLHPDITDESVEVSRAEARYLLSAGLDLKEAEAREREARSWALDQMGSARHLTASGVKVARRQANKSGVSFVPLPKNLPLLTDMENAS